MRFAPVAFSALALAALAGCSSPVPAVPDAAWVVNMSSAGSSCQIMINTGMFGDVNDSSIQQKVTDATAVMGETAAVTCSVVPAGSGFNVQGSAYLGVDGLVINVPAITTAATKDNPATGSVSFQSDKTVVAYVSNSCDFYFINQSSDGKDMNVTAGKIWGAFTCADISDVGTGSMCPVNESYFAFESCLTM